MDRLLARLVLIVASLLTGAEGAAAPVKAEPVAPGVWFVQGEAALGSPANRNFISNAGIVATPAGAVVVDALGSPALADELITEAERLTGQPVRVVIVTHYHADHIYGLVSFRAKGAQILAHRGGLDYLNSETAQRRLEASRVDLAPWVDAKTELVPATRWLDGDTDFEFGGERFLIRHVGPAHTAEDIVVYAERSRVLFRGDLVFRGRVPYVGQADSGHWIESLDRLIALRPAVVVPGHGPLSREPLADMQLTRDYLAYLRQSMGAAAEALEPFEDAYARTDWSRFEHLPLFKAANRMNAYNTYLLMERAGKP
jgi:glyoxylase-like metal-dependent hydrolase (beta-lactamase superfamily II)